MRIVFAGTPEVAVPSLRVLVDSEHEVVGVITREDAPLGRKRVLTPSPVALVAEELGLPTLKSNRLGAEETEWVAALGAEIGVIVAYGGLVREPLLSLPNHGWINLHFSELPRWRGAAPVQRALQAGEQEIGVTVFRLVEALDAGKVLSRDSVFFEPGTPAGDALTELASFGTNALLSAVGILHDDPSAGEAQTGESSYAHKLTREDGKLNVSLPSNELLAHWAGVSPEPGAYLMCDEVALKLHAISLLPAPPTAEPGTVSLQSGVAVLNLSDGTCVLERVQPAGKPAMDGAAWLRGRGGEAVLS